MFLLWSLWSPLDKSFNIAGGYEMSDWDVSQIFQKVVRLCFFFFFYHFVPPAPPFSPPHTACDAWSGLKQLKQQQSLSAPLSRESQIKFILLTCVQRIANLGVAARVLVQGLDPNHLGAGGCLVGDGDLVAWTEEGRRVVIAVLHLDHNLHKVPFDWDLLVAHLNLNEEWHI